MALPAPASREVTILATIDAPSTEPDRVGKTDVLVTYRVGPFQSGMVRIPKETFGEVAVQAAIKKDVELKAKYVGMTFKV